MFYYRFTKTFAKFVQFVQCFITTALKRNLHSNIKKERKPMVWIGQQKMKQKLLVSVSTFNSQSYTGHKKKIAVFFSKTSKLAEMRFSRVCWEWDSTWLISWSKQHEKNKRLSFVLFAPVLPNSLSRRESLFANAADKGSVLPALYNNIVAHEFGDVAESMATLPMDDDRFFMGGVVVAVRHRAVPSHNPARTRCRSQERVKRHRRNALWDKWLHIHRLSQIFLLVFLVVIIPDGEIGGNGSALWDKTKSF